MAYRQYTKCVTPTNHVGGVIAQAIVAAAAGALPLLLFGTLIPGVAIIVLCAIIAYCNWWLYDRLVCLGGDRCAVGMLLKSERPEDKTGLDIFDTDFSINLVLAPHLVGATQAKVESDGIQGDLIKLQPPIQSHGWDWEGLTAKQWSNYPDTAVLHCEFEGGGVYDLLQACEAALALATAAAIVCAIPVLGWIACAILQAIAAVIVVAGLITALNDKGNPNDVDEHLGELEENDPAGRGADLLVVKGTWVYDSAHEGWNELHPIKHCQKIGKWTGSWNTSDARLLVKHWCELIETVTATLTVDNQAKPENQWTVHPVIDGCEPEDPPLPPIR